MHTKRWPKMSKVKAAWVT